MTNARQKILNYIVEEQSATAEELSKAFRVTQANIRHHLSILVEQGSLAIIGQKARDGKGRPAQIYSSALQRYQNNLDKLSETLWSTLFDNTLPSEQEAVLKDIARQMVAMYNPAKYNPTRQVYISIRTLNRMNYQAHWEAHSENPRIMLGHCPYQSIVDHHPEICRLDAYLLQELLDTPVRQAERLLPNDRGFHECVFLIDRCSS